MQNNDFNDDSNSMSIGFAPLQKRVIKNEVKHDKNSLLLQQRINQLDHRLVVNITITSPNQLQGHSFRKQLKNYQFQRKLKSSGALNQSMTSQQRQIQQLFATLKDLFSIWRKKISHRFFVVFNNNDLIYFFHKPQDQDIQKGTKKGGSFAIISSKKSSYSTIFTEWKILYENLSKTQIQNERLLLKNKSIQQFWKYLTNSFLEKPIQFEIVSNFYFLNSSEVLALQKFNGKQLRQQYLHIAEKKTNLLGEVQNQLYSLRIQGFWLKENVLQLFKKLEGIFKGKGFEIGFNCHPGSEQMREQCDNL